AIIGVVWGHDPLRLVDFVRRSTRITHTDPKAFHGALAVALAARHSASGLPVSPAQFTADLSLLLAHEGAGEFMELVRRMAASSAHGSARKASRRSGWRASPSGRAAWAGSSGWAWRWPGTIVVRATSCRESRCATPSSC